MSSLDLLHTLRRPALVASGVVLALGALTACGDDETKVDLGDGKSATVKEDGDKVSIKTDQGEITSGKDVKVPDDFPSDLPMLKAKHTITSSVGGGDEKVLMLQAQGELDVQAEHDHIKAEAEKAGWKVEQNTVLDQGGTGQAILELTKGGQKASYVISVVEGEPASAIISVVPAA